MYALLIFLISFNAATAQAQNADVSSTAATPQLIINQFTEVNPSDLNPVDYEDKIENTVYQSGDRLIIIQSIPMKYIKEAIKPNLQPTISDYPAL